MPKHIVIIPDGNRRWAKTNLLPSLAGHYKGSERIKEILNYIKDVTEIEVFTLWGFSTENWDRSTDEVEYLMKLILDLTSQLTDQLIKAEVRFRHLGRKDRLSKDILEVFADLEEQTKHFNRTFCLAIDYGGRDEIIRAIQEAQVQNVEITLNNFDSLLDTTGLPDPDLIIRTSGEQRLSGILPWQSVYSELYFTEKHFPDFSIEELQKALKDYEGRQRRFGK